MFEKLDLADVKILLELMGMSKGDVSNSGNTGDQRRLASATTVAK